MLAERPLCTGGMILLSSGTLLIGTHTCECTHSYRFHLFWSYLTLPQTCSSVWYAPGQIPVTKVDPFVEFATRCVIVLHTACLSAG
ncbi:hypothetical protein BJ742DRAFT_815443 [Cladochytrium replicatum]|nr:hypothetical protein BJ742DRAFT_815443 [Cladochytrium replicatum]